MPARRLSRLGLAIAGAVAVAVPTLSSQAPTQAQTNFAVGIPTVVDPVRGVGEPDMIVDNANNALVTGPGGTGTQTSFFWRTRDGGLSYPLLGPSSGHWICPASGGGDSLGVYDPKTNDVYLTDQEALAQIGSGKIDGGTGALTTKCASAPAMTADRPFEGVLDGNVAPQSLADPGKKILYLSWLCSGCTGISGHGPQPGGIAFGWSDDGVNFHVADPGVPVDNLVTNGFLEGGALTGASGHGNTIVDPVSGYVFTGLTCAGPTAGSPSNCPNGASDNEVGVAIGKPQAHPSGNIGQFASLTYQTATLKDSDGAAMRQPASLFPVLGMDSNRTLYEAYIEGDGFTSTSNPLPSTAWHLMYTYSSDLPDHKVWSKPVRVDRGAQTATSDFGWMAVGDPGKLGFVWLGTDHREHPSLKDTTNVKEWHAFMAETTNGLDAKPTFQQTQVGVGPNHINDMCLQGTVGCIQNVGNRNMADFISADIGPDGALQAVWANDSNQLHTLPTTLIPGLPLTETARQVSGPRLRGSGDVNDARFSTVPTPAIADRLGDALFPVQGGTNQPQLDLTGSRVDWDGSNLHIHVSAANLGSTSSPDQVQSHVWYLTTWQFNHTIYFARAESDMGGALTFAAGPAKSFDRVGLNAQTVATLADYSGGTTVQGSKNGNDIEIIVPASTVGGPTTGSLFEITTAYSALDSGLPLFVGPGTGNMPTITDATPARNVVLGQSVVSPPPATPTPTASGSGTPTPSPSQSPGTIGNPNTSGVSVSPAAVGLAVAAVVALVVVTSGRRRRRRMRR